MQGAVELGAFLVVKSPHLTSAPVPWSGDLVSGLLIPFPFCSLSYLQERSEVRVTRSAFQSCVTWAASCSVPRCLSVSDDPLSSMGVGAVLCLLSQLWDSSVSSEHGSLKPQTRLPYSSTLVSMSLCCTLPYRMVKQTTVGGHTCLGSQPRSRWAQTFEGHSDGSIPVQSEPPQPGPGMVEHTVSSTKPGLRPGFTV